jgi:hypothetical protein
MVARGFTFFMTSSNAAAIRRCYSPLLFAAGDSDAGIAVAIRSSPPPTAFKPGRQMQRLTERLLEEFARISLEQFLIRDAVASTATIHFTT